MAQTVNTSNQEFETIKQDLLEPVARERKLAGKLWIRFLVVVILLGLFSYIHQLFTGLGVTAMRDYSAWGIYIAHFVFLVAVSLVGSLVTAVLKLLNIKWATPLTRISEIIAVTAVALAAVTIVIDMGRPDRLLNVFLNGRLSSPILWDITVVNTYLVISLILLYIPMIPDLALLRDNLGHAPKWQHKLYKTLSLGWKGTPKEWKILKRTVFILLVLIMPVAFAIHTVTSWLFAVNPRAGWHSTIFGPYFVAGAFMVGAAAVIVAMYVFRKTRKNMENYITDKHFSMMGKLLALTGIIYLYFNINEYLVPGYLMEKREGAHLIDLFLGHDALLFWATQIGGLVLPIILLIFKPFRKPLPAAIIAVAVVFFAWTKRYLIVVPTQFSPSFPIQNVPESWHHYIPTYYEITITLMTIGIILLLITWFAKYFPIVPVWETMKDKGIQDKMLDGYHEAENKE